MKNLLKALAPGLLACAIAGAVAWGANNYAATEGSGKTFSCTDVAGVCFPAFTLANTSGTDIGASLLAAAQAGTATNGATYPASSVGVGGDGLSAEPSVVTTGQIVPAMRDLVGKDVTSPYAPRELMVRGAASSTSNTAVDLIAAGGASVKNYVTAVQCSRSDAGTTAITVAINDDTPTTLATLVLPNNGGGGGNNVTFPVPLVTAANKKVQFTPGTSTTTVYCNAQGFKGY